MPADQWAVRGLFIASTAASRRGKSAAGALESSPPRRGKFFARTAPQLGAHVSEVHRDQFGQRHDQHRWRLPGKERFDIVHELLNLKQEQFRCR
jgi:hypothetical protein